MLSTHPIPSCQLLHSKPGVSSQCRTHAAFSRRYSTEAAPARIGVHRSLAAAFCRVSLGLSSRLHPGRHGAIASSYARNRQSFQEPHSPTLATHGEKSVILSCALVAAMLLLHMALALSHLRHESTRWCALELTTAAICPLCCFHP
jgi:hypothetical protein